MGRPGTLGQERPHGTLDVNEVYDTHDVGGVGDVDDNGKRNRGNW
ncbi:hypothetical protein DWB77_00692 [Streptomyces hundungensis]|uniref:Uncharacterized protein n=1 Tax=Streptomyces hundungensis TaxID=1077946 RepID=A0A387H5C8_9ACTN|nr:hypothetical protein DWB77_00692 [Streptomyces hundungensis]